MHLMSAERRCFEDLTATLHDGPAMKEGGAWIKLAKAHTNGWKEETTCGMSVWLFVKLPWLKSCQQVTSPKPFHAL
ncbi:MAG TPA: hypothetical protein DEA75_02510 [Rhodobacteraceae bacterium]|jgi:hypothetical protein|nr:hypothetical protein [Paracoccaceae bacterium]